MDVGVRELKQHLSDYLDRVERGQTITITERGRPKVMLVPLPGGGDRLADGIAEGWITPAVKPRSPGAPKRFRSVEPIIDLLDRDRGD
ncbi:MAG: type II toxin-antitoxin system Phd/YefM family antitoxin [Ilumatobacteraceae bacterium]|nr:type II toxin-antitoxin system Phd/YefM family antitoxin [Ilumatobacteraceae bacterium]